MKKKSRYSEEQLRNALRPRPYDWTYLIEGLKAMAEEEDAVLLAESQSKPTRPAQPRQPSRPATPTPASMTSTPED